ncbi:hypothetical protein B0H34DRAFT_645288 [Crassisporium funariophilum]|nr:hypothetical protein B0H34DRAFT_645288 [Crassisporium funariophilum]
MLSTFLALLVTAAFYSLRVLGHTIRIGRIGFFSVHNLSYSSKTSNISVKYIGFSLHLPRPTDPYWATISLNGYEYEDHSCHVTLNSTLAKLWFFPVLFRYSSGPWVAATLDGFKIRVFASTDTPWWMEKIRTNVIETILNGDTIRLHDLKTRIFFSALTASKDGYQGEVEKPGLAKDEAQDELRLKCYASQWHIFNQKYRIYTFGNLEADLRRSWVEDRGSFVVIATDTRWTKLSVLPYRESTRRPSRFGEFMHAIFRFPADLFKICRDPMSTMDLYVPNCEVTFSQFRLRDAQIFHEGATSLKLQYDEFNGRNPGVLHDFAWDLFVNGVLAVCQD